MKLIDLEYEHESRCSKSYSYNTHFPNPREICPKKNINAFGAEAKICSVARRSSVDLCVIAL